MVIVISLVLINASLLIRRSLCAGLFVGIGGIQRLIHFKSCMLKLYAKKWPSYLKLIWKNKFNIEQINGN